MFGEHLAKRLAQAVQRMPRRQAGALRPILRAHPERLVAERAAVLRDDDRRALAQLAIAWRSSWRSAAILPTRLRRLVAEDSGARLAALVLLTQCSILVLIGQLGGEA